MGVHKHVLEDFGAAELEECGCVVAEVARLHVSPVLAFADQVVLARNHVALLVEVHALNAFDVAELLEICHCRSRCAALADES